MGEGLGVRSAPVTVRGVAEADRAFNLLMGDVKDPRKCFVQAPARSVSNLDI